MTGSDQPQTSLQPSAGAPRRPRYRALIGVLFAIIAFVFLGLALRGQGDDIGASLDRLSWWALGGAELALLCGVAASLLAWRTILAGLGRKLRFHDAARIFFLGQLGKYVPGSVWPVVMQMEMGTALDVPRPTMFWATAVTMVLTVVSGAMVGIIAVPALLSQGGNGYLIVLLAVPLGIGLLHPRVLNGLVSLALRLFRREPLEHRITLSVLTQAFLWTLVTWAANGVHVFILARSVGSSSSSLLALSFGGYAIAWVAGFLFVVSPAGLGVREAVLILCLSAVLSAGSASAVALVSRLLVTAADGIVAAVAVVSYLAFRRADQPRA